MILSRTISIFFNDQMLPHNLFAVNNCEQVVKMQAREGMGLFSHSKIPPYSPSRRFLFEQCLSLIHSTLHSPVCQCHTLSHRECTYMCIRGEMLYGKVSLVEFTFTVLSVKLHTVVRGWRGIWDDITAPVATLDKFKFPSETFGQTLRRASCSFWEMDTVHCKYYALGLSVWSPQSKGTFEKGGSSSSVVRVCAVETAFTPVPECLSASKQVPRGDVIILHERVSSGSGCLGGAEWKPPHCGSIPLAVSDKHILNNKVTLLF